MAGTNDKRIPAATFSTTLLDFTDVGDISVFIDDAEIKMTEPGMSARLS